MGKKFNKVLYTVIVVIILLILAVKFFFKRPLPISSLNESQKNEHLFFKRKTIPDAVKPKNLSNVKMLKKLVKIRREKVGQKDVDFINRGKKYHFIGVSDKSGVLVQDIDSGKKSKFTGSLMVKVNSKSELKSLLEKYNLKLIKSFSHLNYYYLSSSNIERLRHQLGSIMEDKSFNSVELEILSHPVKVK